MSYERLLALGVIIPLIVASYFLVSWRTPDGTGVLAKAAWTGLVATILIHLFIMFFDEGIDQFVLISVVMCYVYGFVGGLFMAWLAKQLKDSPNEDSGSKEGD